jgi:hypothetical protein
MENILSRGVHRVFDLPNKASPDADPMWKLGNAQFHMEEALSLMLSYTDALRVAVALNDYADRISVELEQRSNCRIGKTSGEKS